MDKHAVAIVLEEIGTLLEIHGENKFKARAFVGAARSIEKMAEDLNELTRRDELQSIPGVGPATAGVIRELVNTGTSRYYLQLRDRTPDGLLELLAVPRLGATRIKTLHEKLGIESIDDLEQAARAGRLASLSGFGARTEQRILEGIAYVRSISGRRRLADSIELGNRLRGFAAALPRVVRAELAGELRRRCETINAIEVVAAVEPNRAADVINRFLDLPGVLRGDRSDPNRASARLSDGVELRITCVPDDEFATTLLLQTGSTRHVEGLHALAEEAGLELSTAGLRRSGKKIPTADEAAVYAALGLSFIEPELRETGREIEAAARAELPTLVTYQDLRGCFHSHTSYSDGKATVEQMAEAAAERGWRYLGIADHSQYASYAGGLSPDEIARQHDEIDDWNERHGRKVWVFKGIEADILPDGRLDYEDQPDLLASFDFIVGSVHSAFAQDVETQTQRFLRVLQNPYLTFLGHLTGRLLLSRKGYAIDLPVVLQAAAERGVGIEINSDPHRMELDWRHWPQAKALGIKTAINPDAHSQRQLDFVQYGVPIARKGWLEQSDVVNTWTLSEVKKYFRQTRKV
jgi:DNA polymerase (family 10)